MQSANLIFFPISEPENTMAFTREDKVWLGSEIRTNISEHATSCTLAHRPANRRERIIAFIHKWGLHTIAVGILGAAVTILIFVVKEWGDYQRFRGSTESSIQTINADIREVKGYLWQMRAKQEPEKTIKEISGLDQREFNASLPGLRAIGEQSINVVKPSPDVLHNVAQKLLAINERPPDYWSTVLQFIQFASVGLSPDAPPPGKPTSIFRQIHGFGIKFESPISHEVVLLDDVDLADMRFEHCRIIFTENRVRMINVVFVDCVFEMPETDNPTPYMKTVGRQLLASNLLNVSIPSL